MEKKYTKEKPTEQGWYWCNRPDIEVEEIVFIYVEEDVVLFVIGDFEYAVVFTKDEEEVKHEGLIIGGKNIEWYGPLVPPSK